MRLYTFSYKDQEYLKTLEKKITKNNPQVTFAPTPETANYIFAVGGDGTILASKDLAIEFGLPIIGINSGTLGFLSSSDDIDLVINAIMEGTERVVQRKLINLVDHLKIPSLTVGQALNDIVISTLERGKLLNLNVEIRGESIVYSCDSLIISTPAGSTAYNLSAGGSIVHPDVPSLILTPVAPFSMSARSIIIPEDWDIRLVSDNSIFVKFDGTGDLALPANEPSWITVDGSVRIVRIDDVFFKSIQEKLKWNLPIKN